MNFFRYIFGFLYVRNWYTGAKELSRHRLYWFLAAVTVFLVSMLFIYLAQLPVVYERVL